MFLLKKESTNSNLLKIWRSSTFSPTPMYLTGILNSSLIPRTTPPFAVPSSFVIAIEVTHLTPQNVFQCEMIDTSSEFKEGWYGFLGYPGTKNGLIYGSEKMKNRPYVYYDKSLEAKNVTSFQYDNRLNILIRYQHKKSISKGVGPGSTSSSTA